jgi:hypothetical protein
MFTWEESALLERLLRFLGAVALVSAAGDISWLVLR